MPYNRRQFLAGASAASAVIGAPSLLRADSHPIRIGVLLDTSGPFDAYGKPMSNATELAIAQINDTGGLLGRNVEAVAFDTQSKMDLYTQYAQQLVRRGDIDVVHGGILSASREAIRPVLRKRGVLYFYNVLYEGGVCDRNVFCTGITPAQQVEALIPHVIEKWGKNLYVLAANYNYGQITADWVEEYANRAGGNIVQTDFFDLGVADFEATVTRIQEAAPDMVVSVLVGGNHLSFYRQWAAAGMNRQIPMASTTLGVGNEHKVLTAEESAGIIVAYNWSESRTNAANQDFLAAWSARFGDTRAIHEIAVSQYQGLMLWAEGVRKAGTVERMPLIEALEEGVGIDGPGGRLSIDRNTHHCSLDIHVMEVQGQTMNVIRSYDQRQPLDTQRYCDLVANPDDTQQYEISL